MLAGDNGKTEAWVVVHAEPGSRIYAGLQPGVNREQFARALETGEVEPLLHQFEAQVGDCIFIPAGTVHAIGAGVVIAEIQQMSDATFRVFDWNRVGADGKPRTLHIEQALASIDFETGPVQPRSAEAQAVAGWRNRAPGPLPLLRDRPAQAQIGRPGGPVRPVHHPPGPGRIGRGAGMRARSIS